MRSLWCYFLERNNSTPQEDYRSLQRLPSIFKMQRDQKKSDAVVEEFLIDNMDSEKPSTPLMPTIPAYRRSLELARPKLKQTPLPLPLGPLL